VEVLAVVEGIDKVARNINRQLEKMKEVSIEGLEEVGLDLLGKAVRQAPVDTGDLRGSGSVSFGGNVIAQGTKEGGVVATGKAGRSAKPEVTVGFSVPYAHRQHEDLEYHHPRGGKAKYLEDPLKQNAKQYVRHIAEKVREVNK
jgi:hypothetical protein